MLRPHLRLISSKHRFRFQELFARLQDGTLTLPVASTHALGDISAAVAASDTPGRVGKVLLRP